MQKPLRIGDSWTNIRLQVQLSLVTLRVATAWMRGSRPAGHKIYLGPTGTVCHRLCLLPFCQTFLPPGGSLTGKKKKVFQNQFSQKSPRALHVLNHGWWRLAVGGWQLATGGWWRLVVVGGGWWLVIGGWWRLTVVGSWRLVAVGGWRRLVAVGGWRLVAIGG